MFVEFEVQMWRSSQKAQVFKDLYNLILDDDVEPDYTPHECSESSSLVLSEKDSDNDTAVQSSPENDLFFVDDHGERSVRNYTRNECSLMEL